jgi:serine protease Do
MRDGKEVPVDVKVAAMPTEYGTTVVAKPAQDEEKKDAASFDDLGIEVSPLTDDVAEQLGFDSKATGVVITQVEEGSPAQMAGLDTGIIIERVGKTPVKNVDEFRSAIEASKKDGKNVLLLVRTPQGGRFLTLKAK